MTTPQANGELEVVEHVLAARSSCRAFKPDEVPRATIERILTAAQRTASWSNSQAWQVTIFSGAATNRLREDLYKSVSEGAKGETDFPFPREYRGVYQDRRRENGFQLYNAVGIARGDKAAYQKQALENFRFFGAPHVAIVTSDEALGVYGAIDCGCYVSNFMLAAQAAGVATIAQAALAAYSNLLHKHLGIGDDRRVVCGISFGYADETHPVNGYRTTRAPISEAAVFVDS